MFHRPGDLICGRFEMLSLGEEAPLGELYRARDGGEAVSIWVLQPDLLPNDGARERFVADLTASGEPVRGVFFDDAGCPLVVVNHIDSAPLRRLLVARQSYTKEAFSSSEAWFLFRQMAAFVQRVHARDEVLFDLSIDSLFVGAAVELHHVPIGRSLERVRLCQALERAQEIARLAPELRRGGPADRQSDLYALGALGHLLFFGRLPDPERLEAEDSLLARILHRTLHDNPRKRPSDVDELCRDLAVAIDSAMGEPTEPSELSKPGVLVTRQLEAHQIEHLVGRNVTVRVPLDALSRLVEKSRETEDRSADLAKPTVVDDAPPPAMQQTETVLPGVPVVLLDKPKVTSDSPTLKPTKSPVAETTAISSGWLFKVLLGAALLGLAVIPLLLFRSPPVTPVAQPKAVTATIKPKAMAVTEPVNCPGGMAAVTGYAACIDRFEYPGRALPTTRVAFEESGRLCSERGARLCTAEEWQAACEGRERRSYPYGSRYEPTYCNTEKRAALLPSGSLPECRNPNDVFDLSGNAAEWVIDEGKAAVKGGSSDSGPDARCTRTLLPASPTGEPRVGFRCCLTP